jgi:NitT/TauT family transport system permease protein
MSELARDGRLIDYSIASLFRVTAGWYLAVLLAVPAGLALGWRPGLADAVNPLLQFLRPISPLAWIPLALVWFGIGDPPAVFLIFLASFFPLAVSAMGAVANIKRLYIRAARNMGMSGTQLALKVVFPATLPSIIVSLRITLGIAWLVVVAAEMIAVRSGLGYLIIDARNSLRLDLVIDGMILIGVIGIVLDRAILQLEKLESMRWAIGKAA